MSTEVITGTTINRIRRSAKRGDSLEVHDLIQPGLSIRATGRRMTWYFRFTTKTQRTDGTKVRTAHPICAVDGCPDPEKMRQVVGAGCAALQEGRDPLAAVRVTLAEALRLPETRVSGEPSLHTWDFPAFREEFKNDPPSDLRKDTVDGYYRALSKTQVGTVFYAKRLVEITPQNIRTVRDDILRRGHARQSKLTLQALRTAFDWATESSRSALSGLTEDNNPMSQVVSKRRRNQRKPTNEDAIAAEEFIKLDINKNFVVAYRNVPTMADIGKLLILLLQPAGLPLVKRTILLLLVYSVQRRLTVASAFRKALVGFHQRDVAFWVLDGGTTKSGRPHLLPFSMRAWGVIESWRATLSKSSVWLFPGMATRRKPSPNGHINVRTVNEWMYEACDLAGCARHSNPHSVRKAFSTYLSTRGISKAEVKLILDHTEGRGTDVTEVHYNFDPRLPEKQKVMAVWNSFLDECIKLAQNPREISSPDSTGSVTPVRVGDKSHFEPIVQPSSVQILQLPAYSDVPAVRPKPQTGVSDSTRLDKLRAKLDSRKQLDETLERSLRKRPI